MSPLVKKEIRLLLPGWVTSLALALSIWLLPEHLESRPGVVNSLFVFPFLLCPLMLIMTVLGSFGREFHSGTFSLLLAQPVSRARVWWTKTLLQAFAVLAVWFVWCYSEIASGQINANLRGMEVFTVLLALAVYSGGLWSVLLLRQVAAAFWFTVLAPGALFMTISNLLGHHPDKVVNHVLMGVFSIYGIAGYWFAYWLFMRAQDSQWTGGTIVMPEVRGLARFNAGPGARRLWRPRAALLIKELQLHQSQFVLAGVLALLHVGALATRRLGHFPMNSSLEFVLENFWLLWLVMTFLVGCAAVAEERKLGTHEGQLCLPARRRTQFRVKLSVVLLLSLLFGVALPLLAEGTRVLPDAHIRLFDAYSARFGNQMPQMLTQVMPRNLFWKCLAQINQLMPLLTLAGIATGIGVIALYISTLARNTLQALAPAVLGLILFVFLMSAAQMEQFARHPLWRGELIYFIGLPVLSLTLLTLAFWNFRHTATGWQLWLRNLLTLAASLALVVGATTAIYHRAWERLTPFEPAHGAARLTLIHPASFIRDWNGLLVRLPNGRTWMTHFIAVEFPPSPLDFLLGNFKVAADKGGYLDGSNWATVRYSLQELVGIKTDGTLWVSEKPWRANRFPAGDRNQNTEELHHLVQFGNETNWSCLRSFGSSVLLMKDDGTLWRWGPTKFDVRNKQWSELRLLTPHQLGTESNWAGFLGSGYQTFLRKKDGSIWVLDHNEPDTNGVTFHFDGLNLRALTGRSPGKFRGTAEAWLGGNISQVGIREDGTLRAWADSKYDSGLRVMVLSAIDYPISQATNWLAVADSGQKIVTLKDDGSLWLWDFFYRDRRFGWNVDAEMHRIQNTIPIRLGTHSDWIAITGAENGIISLAADGSLWFWPMQRPMYYNNLGMNYEPLLDMPKKPIFLVNIFGSTN